MELNFSQQHMARKNQIWYWVLLVFWTIIVVLLAYFQTKFDFSKKKIDIKNNIVPQQETQTTGWKGLIGVDSMIFKATWTEPFWSLSFSSWIATYSSPDALEGESYSWFTLVEQNTSWYTLKNPQNMILILSPNTEDKKCSDGMSETEYNGYITLTLPNGIILDNWCIQTTLFNQ